MGASARTTTRTFRVLKALSVIGCLILSAVGCRVGDETEEPAAICDRPSCEDAGPPTAAEAEAADAVPNVMFVDASTPPIPELPDGGQVVLRMCEQVACFPDDAESCSGFEQAEVNARQRQVLSLPAFQDDAGTAGLPTTDLTDAGTSGPIVDLADAGISRLPDAGAETEIEYGCQFTVNAGQLSAECGVAGRRIEGEPCTSSRECEAGLGCVGEPDSGRCLAFCCSGECHEEGQFCAERPLLTGDVSDDAPHLVPVCAEARTCDLGEELTCDDPQGCGCPGEFTCSVVSAAGETGCVMPGDGQQGEQCPCAPGFFCSPAQEVCLEMCQIDVPESCGEHICQPGPNFPEGWGLCIALPETMTEAEYR